MPNVTGVLETSLYFDDLDRAAQFYQELFGFTVIAEDHRIRALRVREGQVLLLFKRGASVSAEQFPNHDGSGALHLAFSIPESEFQAWEKRLREMKIPIEQHKKWELGGQSLYFRDLENHLLELPDPFPPTQAIPCGREFGPERNRRQRKR
jgi:catechol-2,3-dioxygenase